MTGAAEDWHEYIGAAKRKITIARYHLDRLREEPAQVPEPSIAEQAYFEGVIGAFVSATGQTAGAIHVARGGNGNAPPLSRLLGHIPASNTTTRLKAWDKDRIVSDVRSIRNLAAHRYYKKAGVGHAAEVQNPAAGSSYGGPRELPTISQVRHGLAVKALPLTAQMGAATGVPGATTGPPGVVC